jgi:hypothetical protein
LEADADKDGSSISFKFVPTKEFNKEDTEAAKTSNEAHSMVAHFQPDLIELATVKDSLKMILSLAADGSDSILASGLFDTSCPMADVLVTSNLCNFPQGPEKRTNLLNRNGEEAKVVPIDMKAAPGAAAAPSDSSNSSSALKTLSSLCAFPLFKGAMVNTRLDWSVNQSTDKNHPFKLIRLQVAGYLKNWMETDSKDSTLLVGRFSFELKDDLFDFLMKLSTFVKRPATGLKAVDPVMAGKPIEATAIPVIMEKAPVLQAAPDAVMEGGKSPPVNTVDAQPANMEAALPMVMDMKEAAPMEIAEPVENQEATPMLIIKP